MPTPSSYERVPFGSTLLPTDPPVKPPAPRLPPRPPSMHSQTELTRAAFVGETYARVQKLKESAERLAAEKPKTKPPVPKPRKADRPEQPDVYRAPTFYKNIVKQAPVLPPIPLKLPQEDTPVVIPRKTDPARTSSGRASPERTPSERPSRESDGLPTQDAPAAPAPPTLDAELLSLKSRYDNPADTASVAPSEVAPLAPNRQSFQTVGDNLDDLIASLDQLITSSAYTVVEPVEPVEPLSGSDDEPVPDDPAAVATFQDLWEAPRPEPELEAWLASLRNLLQRDHPHASSAQVERVLGQFLAAVRQEGAIVEGGSRLVFLDGVHIPGSISFGQTSRPATELADTDWTELWAIPDCERHGQAFELQDTLHQLLREELWFSHNCRKMGAYGKGFLKQEALLLPSFPGFFALAFEPFRGLRACWRTLCPSEVAETLSIDETLDAHRAWLASLAPRYMHYVRGRRGALRVLEMQADDSHLRQWIRLAPSPKTAYELSLRDLLGDDFVTAHLDSIAAHLTRLAELEPAAQTACIDLAASVRELKTRASQNELTMSRMVSELQPGPELDPVDVGSPRRFWAGEFDVGLLVSKRRELRCRAIVFDNYVVFVAANKAVCAPLAVAQLSCSVGESHARSGQMVYAATLADFSNEYAVLSESRAARDALVKVCLEMQAAYMRTLDFGMGYEVLCEREFAYTAPRGRHTAVYPGDTLAAQLTAAPTSPQMVADATCFTSFEWENTTFHMLGSSFGLHVTRAGTRDWYAVVELPGVTRAVVLGDEAVVVVLARGALHYVALGVVMEVHALRAGGRAGLLTVGLRRLLTDARVFSLDCRRRKAATAVTVGYTSRGRHFLATLQAVVAPVPGEPAPQFSHFEKTEETALPPFSHHVTLRHVDVVLTADGFRSLSQRNQYPLPLECADAQLRQRIARAAPVAVHPLSGRETLLVYARFAVFVSPAGAVSRPDVVEFPFTCVSSALVGGALVVFGQRGVQAFWLSQPARVCLVRSAQQVRMLSADGVFSAAHPAAPDRQLVCRVTVDE